MSYKSIEINRKNFTVMGVNFNPVANFEAALNALGTLMFEGFDFTLKSIVIIRPALPKVKEGSKIHYE